MRLWLEIEGSGRQADLPGDGAALCAFCSFAVSRGFGATHPLIALADRAHSLGVRMGPLTTFYDGTIEDAEDREKLELAWQEAAPLRDALAQLVATLSEDERSRALARRGGAEGLEQEAAVLLTQAAEAANEGKRVRMVYEL